MGQGTRGGTAIALAVAAMAAAAVPAHAVGATPAQDRAAALVARLTTDEKLALAAGATAIPRLGIPQLAVSDGPNGIGAGAKGTTAFPAAISLAASWDPALARRYGDALGAEAIGKGKNLLFAPTVNVVRSPLWGRTPETSGEDPYLTGSIARPEIEGVQARGVIAQVKHYAGNDQEAERLGEPVALAPAIDTKISERALREIYLAPFRMVLGPGGAASVMCSYNRVNGTPACQDAGLLGALRKDFAFDGFVGPDATLAVRDTLAAANAGTDDFLLGSLGAASGTPDLGTLRAALADGRLPAARLDAMVRNQVAAILAVGVKAPGAVRPKVSSAAHISVATDIAARGAVLLRNRGGVLPLRDRRGSSVAVIGADAGAGTQVQEFGSPSTIGGPTVTPLAGIRARVRRGTVTYAEGTRGVVALPQVPAGQLSVTRTGFASADFSGAPLHVEADHEVEIDGNADLGGAKSVRWTGTFTPRASGPQRFSLGLSGIASLWVGGRLVAHGNSEAFRQTEMSGFGVASDNTFHAVVPLRKGKRVAIRIDYSNDSVPPAAPFRADLHLGYAPPGGRIAAAARAARRADVAVVFANTIGGETMDQQSLALPGDQDALIEAVAKANRNTVVVLHTGGPVLTPRRSRVAAIVEDWYPGERSGDAIAQVLFGEVDPSGRLPLTFPASASQGPATRPAEFPGVGGVADHDEGLDVGYRYYDAHGQAPAFPFGFGLSYTSFRLGRPRATGALGKFSVSVPVRNVGHRTGTQTVQVYAGFTKPIGEPPRRLVRYAQVTLAPGRRGTVEIETDPKAFAVWNTVSGGYAVPAGPIRLWAGTSSRDLRSVG